MKRFLSLLAASIWFYLILTLIANSWSDTPPSGPIKYTCHVRVWRQYVRMDGCSYTSVYMEDPKASSSTWSGDGAVLGFQSANEIREGSYNEITGPGLPMYPTLPLTELLHVRLAGKRSR